MNVSKSVLTVAATLCGLLCGCGGSSAGERSAPAERATRKNISLIEGVSPLYGATVPQGSVQRIGFRLRAGAEADSVVLYMGERRVAALDTAGYPYEVSAAHPTGKVLYKVVAYREGRSDSRSGEFAVLAGKAPVLYGHRVRNVYPHDRTAYTQGLLWHDGYLYESTGLEGGSTLRQVDLTDGRVVRSVPLDDSYFGEGLALLGGKLYQLTWRSNKGFVYDLKTFERVGEFGYGGEGWGLATDGTSLYQSDGTEKIRVIDPETFRTVRTIEVCTDRSRVPYINELEWIDGELWANVYTTDTVIRIDPRTGAVVGVIDLAGLLSPADVTAQTDVLNGIAYDAKTGRIFVTGKNWNKLSRSCPSDSNAGPGNAPGPFGNDQNLIYRAC